MLLHRVAVLLHRGRERLVRQRTGLVNALRGHLAELGVIAPQGLRNVGKLIAIVRDEGDARLPDLARQVLQVLAAQIEQLEAAVAAIEKQLMAWHKSNPVSQRLASRLIRVPGAFLRFFAILVTADTFAARSLATPVAAILGLCIDLGAAHEPRRQRLLDRYGAFSVDCGEVFAKRGLGDEEDCELSGTGRSATAAAL